MYRQSGEHTTRPQQVESSKHAAFPTAQELVQSHGDRTSCPSQWLWRSKSEKQGVRGAVLFLPPTGYIAPGQHPRGKSPVLRLVQAFLENLAQSKSQVSEAEEPASGQTGGDYIGVCVPEMLW